MNLKWLKRRFGAQAPRLAIRPQMPWYLRSLVIAGGAIAVGGLLWLAYLFGQSYADLGEAQAQSTHQPTPPTGSLESANAVLKSELAIAQRQLQIERAAQLDLAKQVKALANDNAQLKEEIEILQAVSAPAAATDGVRVSSARVESNAIAGEYTYRIVLVQTGSRTKPFQGSYQLIVNMDRGGVRTGISIPEAADLGSSAYKLDFRVHQRIDGTFKVAPDADVRSVQLRIFEGAQRQPKVMQTVTVS